LIIGVLISVAKFWEVQTDRFTVQREEPISAVRETTTGNTAYSQVGG
jgi:hypothetical protein